MASAWLGFPPWRVLHPKRRSGACFRSQHDHVALTFDDGPHPERTPAVLDALARFGVQGTFFLVGDRAARQPALVERIAREGHVIGNHGWSHRWLYGADLAVARDEVDRCQDVLGRLSGRGPTLLRPAFGWTTPVVERVLRERHLTPVFWSIDTLDYVAAPTSVVLWRMMSARAGDVVLLHDGAEQARGTIVALERYLSLARERGRAIGPFHDVMPGATA